MSDTLLVSQKSVNEAKSAGSDDEEDVPVRNTSPRIVTSSRHVFLIGSCMYLQHKFVIQATVLRGSWPLSESQWLFAQQLRENEKEELKGENVTHFCRLPCDGSHVVRIACNELPFQGLVCVSV